MYRLLGLIASFALVLGLAAGCGGSATSNPDGSLPPRTDGGGTNPDGPGTPPQAALQQTIMDKLSLPTTGGEYGKDLDGTGAKNQLGTLIAAIQSFFPDLQTNIDTAVNDGTMIMLFELFAKSLTDDANVTAQAHMGADTDGDATNNFSGSATLGIASFSPADAILAGSIAGGNLQAGPGKLVIPLKFQGQDVVVITVEKAHATATVSASGMANGVLAGALTESEIDTRLAPLLVNVINAQLPNMEPNTQQMLLTLVDSNDNGVIEASDLKEGVVGAALKPDIDTNSDGTPDALSIGVGFSSVPCVIQK